MFEIVGKYNTAKVYAAAVDAESYAQVLRMCNTEALRRCAIRMMPDMHAAEGCTVGTSMTIADAVNPSYVGGDIGCGMQVFRLSERETDLPRLDDVIREYIPSGAALHPAGTPAMREVPLESLFCRDSVAHADTSRAFGTLGGGNHFIELDRGLDGQLYLVIHSGSRSLGRDAARHHQAAAFFLHHGIEEAEVKRKKLRPADLRSTVRPEDCFLSGEPLMRYLADMRIAVAYAERSRHYMGETILARMGLHAAEEFSTIHNYIDTDAGVLRKGAVSAQNGEKLLIPINMRDGSLLCTGKGNPDWNCTAPHGAGRVLKRAEAKEQLALSLYREEMQGIYTTSVSESTLDESPMAYRRIDEILDAVEPTVQVDDILTPVYNFKASRRAAGEDTHEDAD